MELLNRLVQFWPHAVAALTLLLAGLASAHAILNKRDTRATVLWIGFICLLPLLGPVLYLLLGINRVRRKAQSLRGAASRIQGPDMPDSQGDLRVEAAHLEQLSQVVKRIVRRPLTPGNKIEPLVNGDAAYPAMLAAIGEARKTIGLATYIFDNDKSGLQFVEALRQAVARGVQVRVLIDAAGTHYSVPSIVHALHHARVPVGRFLPTMAPWRLMSMNLRLHRKIMVVDGRIGFTGGMNLREGNLVAQNPRHPVRDLHFRLEGPVVAQLQEAFANDWLFAAKEALTGADWFPPLEAGGGVMAPAHVAAGNALVVARRTVLRAGIGENRDALFSAGKHAGFRAESGGVARREGGDFVARAQQSSLRRLGLARHVVASAGIRLQNLALSAAVRSFQAHVGGRRMVPGRFRQLGHAQPAAQL